MYDQYGSSIIYSESTNEELEELFRRVVLDEEFLKICQQELKQHEQKFTENNLFPFLNQINEYDYEDISANDGNNEVKPRVIHEINMSVQYDFQLGQNNSDFKFIKRHINVVHKENRDFLKKNRFSNLNLSDDIDRVVKMYDFIHHSHQQLKKNKEPPANKYKSSMGLQEKMNNQKRPTATISTNEPEFSSAALAKIVEHQLEAARCASGVKKFNPIINQPIRKQSISRAKFVEPPKLSSKLDEQNFRHRIDHIEYPKKVLRSSLRKPSKPSDETIAKSIDPKTEREEILSLGQQGIISTAIAFGSRKIPDNVSSIELLEIPMGKRNGKEYKNFQLVSFETIDNNVAPANPTFRRTKSMRCSSKINEISSRSPSTFINDIASFNYSKLSSPLKTIKRIINHKNESPINNTQVFKENSKGMKL